MGNRRGIFALTRAALCVLVLVPAVALSAPGSLVAPSERISDTEARRELARLLAFSDQGRDEAMDILQKQLRQSPDDAEARLALAELLARTGRLPEAEAALGMLPSKFLALAETQERVGDAYFAAGRMAEASRHFQKAMDGGRPVLRKLAQALAWSGDTRQARPMLEKLAASNPADREVALLLVRLRLADGDAIGAAVLARDLAKAAPDSPLALAELADVETALGHASAARSLYEKALVLPGGQELLPRYAQAMNLWGAFGRAITIWREQAAKGDAEAHLPLALAYVAAQRGADAEGVLRGIMRTGAAPGAASGADRAARLALARLKLEEEDPRAALEVLHPLVAQGVSAEADSVREALVLAVQAQRKLGRPQDGLALLSRLPADAEPALRARLLMAAGRAPEAEALLGKAVVSNPKDQESAFLALGDRAAGPAQLDALTAPGARTPAELTAWAALCAEKGWRDGAIRCLRAAIVADAQYFPARMALAETLAASRRYAESLAELDALAAAFPDSSKVLLARARVLSWDRRYDEAQDAYAALAKADASDPVPVREAARVRFWAKERAQALAAYATLRTPPVDQRLAERLDKAGQANGDDQLRDTARNMLRSAAEGSEYRRYERLSLGREPGLSAESALAADQALADLLPAYRIQKGAGLEAEAKDLAFNRRFSRSLPVYDELLAFEPGNQEARFDKAQSACALGLCSQERQAYSRLLEIDPLNTLGGAALERLDQRTAPAVSLRQNVWHEAGRGQLARILRQRTDLGLSAGLADDHRLSLTQHRWYESPRGTQSYEALGQTLAWDGVFSSTLRGAASWTNKRYTMGSLNNVDTGRARLEFNLDDVTRLGLGFERTEELANHFALRQQSQSDNAFVDLLFTPGRDWEIAAELRGKNYSDGNLGDMQKLSIGYSLTDHPRQLKAILSGERRNTENKSQEIYNGAFLSAIRHPYWTPQDYTAASFSLQWRHDLSDLQFCGAPQHYYDLRATAGTDSENNPSVRFEAEWKYEFATRWTVEAKGLVHRSPQWDADGLWLGLGLGF
ncbi:MAG: tetratricopeptide repeat protein [Humidesulfovibrio sp.]|uniref:tetratricopeptide repeat protein n=1 Tax=Humidesulfovibrio sp. TaxID=2910988 RepID=UPI002732FFB1|nr:tetratricopeptide repeat protein [Humidesulfovibrio sp.]MDP2849411.1 tetratricopeptide repeat protein [Humidesulfovibrio sp.]